MIRPQPLLAPRPNVRRLHPLDDYERALVDDPPMTDLETDAHPSGRDLLLMVALIVVSAAVSLWGIWRVAGWVIQ